MTYALNHVPAHKGKSTTTDPIKTLADLAKVKAVIGADVRLLALWTVATNTALRASDLVTLRWSDIQADGTLVVRERKTAKRRVLQLNGPTLQALQAWQTVCESEFIYSGQRGALTVGSWGRIVRDLCERAGLEGQFCSHTCRKTFVRVHLDEVKTPLYVLMKVLNHSTETQTLQYAGKLSDDVAKAYSVAL